MSEIFTAVQRSTDTRVIIKKLSCNLEGQAAILKRFNNEARTASSLSHENIITIFDYGEEKDSFFIVMEQVDGCDLERLMGHPGFNRDVGLMILSRALEGLKFAHKNGVIHCDIKPGNILISRSGRVVLSDFGLSMARAHTMNPAHEKNDFATPLYMPPEQAKVIAEQVGLASDAWAETASIIYTDMSPDQARAIMERGIQWDLWSVGVLLYRLCSGRFPFHGDDLAGLLTAVVHTEEIKIHELVTDLPSHLTNVIQRCLEKEAYRRPHSLDPIIDSLKKHFTTLDITNTSHMIAGHILDKIPEPGPVRHAPLSAAVILFSLAKGKIVSLLSSEKPAPDETPDERYEQERPSLFTRLVMPLGIVLVLAVMVVPILFFIKGVYKNDEASAGPVQAVTEQEGAAAPDKKPEVTKRVPVRRQPVKPAVRREKLPSQQPKPATKASVRPAPVAARTKRKAPVAAPRLLPQPRVSRPAVHDTPAVAEKINAGILKMTVAPDEARVFVDGVMIPRKVLAEGKRLDPGFHDVIVKAPGFESYERSFLLEAYKMQLFDVDLKPETIEVKGNGKLHVYSYPWSDLYIDGTLQGTTPTPAPLVLLEGQHTLLLKRDGFLPHEETVTIKKSEVIRIQVQLQEIEGGEADEEIE
ncbi:MAG: protein kinase [Chitinispirillaceae bacterium]|nr:protein kinase [Chitinispirillaceae bacterium]